MEMDEHCHTARPSPRSTKALDVLLQLKQVVLDNEQQFAQRRAQPEPEVTFPDYTDTHSRVSVKYHTLAMQVYYVVQWFEDRWVISSVSSPIALS
jgi:hypothetical protein